jgi:hypothetical protein
VPKLTSAQSRVKIAISILSAIFLGLFCDSIQAQVINFDVPGGAGASNYSGQGAYSNPGSNYWNAVIGGGTSSGSRLSDGVTTSPITLTSELGGTYGTQGAQGMPAGLQQPYEYNDAELQADTLNKVPAGTYNLYLYGINNTGTRGTTFTVCTSVMSPYSLSTSNTPASLTTFVQGADYVIFSNIVVGADGTIAFTWIGNPNVSLAGNNEGDFNALQLVFISTNTIVANTVSDFGPNVLIFNPSMSMPAIQNTLAGVFANQQNSEFGPSRYTLFFQAGQYSNIDVNLGYYTQVIGLGQNPDDVLITGNVHSEGVLDNDNATVNFWRSCENMAVVPTNNSTMTWAVSQGTSLRRMHVKGNLNLSDTESGAYSSGGFLADSEVDSTVDSITQQQWLSRNDIWGNWTGQNWNMVFVGVSNPPSGSWPNPPYTVLTNTPLIREKPYLYEDVNSNFFVVVPNLETNSLGTTWANGPTPGTSLPISQFYLARPGVDNSGTMNAALNSGLNLILTPGIYYLTNSIVVTHSNAIVLGLGFPTLLPTNSNPAMVINDVDGVKVANIIFDAGTTASPSLLEVGTATSAISHAADPICLYDICSRVGGEFKGTTTNCVTINANDVMGDNFWLWRADHGTGATPFWTGNPSQSGIVVNGNNVTMYGLLVEHHQRYQTLWNGNGGRVYFYQSELPYDPPSQSAWSEAPGVDGYASYKVANTVTSHQAYGLGVYAVFINSTNISCFNAMETPTNPQVNVHHMMDVYIAGNTSGSGTSEITHIINGTGSTVAAPGVITAYANFLWQNPSFSVSAQLDTSGTNLAITLPTESWHTYQLQQKGALTDPGWVNIGLPFTGDDTLETILTPIQSSGRFYQIEAH